MVGVRCSTDTCKTKEPAVWVIPGRNCGYCGKSGYTPPQTPLATTGDEGRENREEGKGNQMQGDSEKGVEAAN